MAVQCLQNLERKPDLGRTASLTTTLVKTTIGNKKEIQSHQQVTLHSGLLYMSITTISPSKSHDPVAIRAHLDHILEIKRQNPDVQHLYLILDGPTTQYKQKGKFYMFGSPLPHDVFGSCMLVNKGNPVLLLNLGYDWGDCRWGWGPCMLYCGGLGWTVV